MVSYSQRQLQPNQPGPAPAGLADHLCGHLGLHSVLCPGQDDKYISPQISSFPQMLVNTLLVVGSLNHISSHLFPWLCVTATCVILAIVSLDESMKSCRTLFTKMVNHQRLVSLSLTVVAGGEPLLSPARGQQAESDPARVHPGADQPLHDRPGQAPHLGPGLCLQEETYCRGGGKKEPRR